MALSNKIFLFFLLLLPLANCANLPYRHSCAKNISDNADLKARVVGIIYHLSYATPATGFMSSNFSSSGNDSIIYGLAQCRGDATADLCSTCVLDAGNTLFGLCANDTQAFIWYDLCFVRYDVVNFLGNWTVEGAETSELSSVEAKNTTAFIPAVKQMVDDLKTKITAPGANLFAKTVVSNITNLEGVNIYGLAQCTRDLKESACIECLDHVEGLLPIDCKASSGCRILYNSCFLRYEIYDFFAPESR